MESLLSAHGLLQHAKRHAGIVPERPLNNLTVSETGCLISNLSLLNSLSEEETVLILEDDVCFSPDFSRRTRSLLRNFSDTNLDLLFLGQTVLFNDLNMHRNLIKLWSLNNNPKSILLEASKSYKFGSFAYAVNGKSIAKIQKLIRAIDLAASATPMDIQLKKWLLSKDLRGAVVFPYLVGVNPEFDTTINDRLRLEDHPLHAAAVNLYLEGQSLDSIKTWRQLLERGPNEQALGLCKLIYDRLTR